MRTRTNYPALATLLLATACSAPQGSPTNTAVPVIQDLELCLHTAMAAISWAKLDPLDRELWEVVWDTAIAVEEAPSQTYSITQPDGTQAHRNLFERSPKDGYCVAFAHYQTGRMAENNICVSFVGGETPISPKRSP